MRLAVLGFLFLTLSVFALATPNTAAPTKQEELKSLERIFFAREKSKLNDDVATGQAVTPLRPYAEYEEAKYLLFHTNKNWDAETVKHTLAQNLPEGMKLVVYASGTHSIARSAH